eukprot:2929175-Lingulodinium_polyedra.AAC.1
MALNGIGLLSTALDGVAWRGTAWHGMAWRGPVWRGIGWHGMVLYGVALGGTAGHGPTYVHADRVVFVWSPAVVGPCFHMNLVRWLVCQVLCCHALL